MYDATEHWVDTSINTRGTQENTSNCCTYMHQDCNLHHRPPINRKDELKEMYLECFSGGCQLKDFEYHIKTYKISTSVGHAPCKIALSLKNKLEKE